MFTDLREASEKNRFSHAYIMARAWDPGLPAVQLGIRSMCKEEAEYIGSQPSDGLLTLFAWDLDTPAKTAMLYQCLSQRPSPVHNLKKIDVDVFC